MKVALIQFKEVGKKYFFNPKKINVRPDDRVIVETIKGLEIGMVYQIKEVEESELTYALKDIIRLATPNDFLQAEANLQLIANVINQTKKLVEKHSLEMKVTNAEYTLDKKKLLIYFEAENRIDFRELVKDLSEVFTTRIELRQIGPRDTAKMVGGIGPCGLILCCSTFIGEFEAVSIKMAKNQNLSLNPQKISGNCGKLLCCIKYEDDVYTELKKTLPDLGDKVKTERGEATVIGINIIASKINLRYDEGGFEWVHLEDLS